MSKIIWRIAYTRIALRSRYDFNLFSAWRESGASWEAYDDMRGGEPMLTPIEAFREDVLEWKYG